MTEAKKMKQFAKDSDAQVKSHVDNMKAREKQEKEAKKHSIPLE
jgi:hypothetical protein